MTSGGSQELSAEKSKIPGEEETKQYVISKPAKISGYFPYLLIIYRAQVSKEVDTELLAEKEQVIQELKETVEIMELKIRKLEELLTIKDNKIQTLTNKLASANIKS